MQTKPKKRSRTRVIIASIAALFLSVLAIGLFYQYLLPYINRNTQSNHSTLLWQGTITDKKTEIQIDHENYYLQINESTWENLQNQQSLYTKYDNGTYVYYISLPDGTYQLTTDPKPYFN